MSDKELLKKKAIEIIQNLRNHGYKAYLCGGCVRDLILQRTPKDYDIVTNARSQDVQQIFTRTIPVGISFGIIRVLIEQDEFEIATFRKDGTYSDGRHPDSIEFCDEKEDALRRDFTINGLFWNPLENKIIDYVGGQDDIQKKLLRTIGNAQERFLEDHLRMMRAVRFAGQLDFNIEENTWQTICSMSEKILTISKERIRDELSNILLSQNPALSIRLLQQSKLLTQIFPKYDIDSLEIVLSMFQQGTPFQSLEEALCILFFSWNHKLTLIESNNPYLLYSMNTAPFFQWLPMLCWSRKTLDYLELFFQYFINFQYIMTMKEAQFKRFIRLTYFQSFLKIYYLYCKATNQDLISYTTCINKMQLYTQEDLFPKALVNGNDLIKLGFHPGPIIKKILQDIETQQLQLNIHTKEEAIQFVTSQYNIL